MADSKSLKADFEKLKESDELKGYLDSHDGAYFVSAFVISSYDDRDSTPWVLEYYHPDSGKVATFSLSGSRWVMSGDDKPLQKESKVLEELDLGDVKDCNITDVAMDYIDSKFEKTGTLKIIVILTSKESRHHWNISVFTKSLKIINLNVDAEKCEVLAAKEENLFDFKKKA